MSEGRDPAIKLFGRKIPLQEEHTPMGEGDVVASIPAMQPPSKEEKVAKQTSTDTEQAAISGQDKLLLKKPDKVLPCPRCNSMDTKFCYYNNYNVNQPRQFCKNCQRYWTAGGSMRNVPVGAGRRKNKHGGSTHRRISITPDALALARADGPDSRSLSPFNGNATLLKFGPDAPLCESMASILSLGDQTLNSQLDFATAGAENREETSCSSACKSKENSMNSYSNGIAPFPHPQYFPGPLWGYPWNPGQEMAWTQPPFFASAFCPAYPFPFLPPFWGWTGRPWNLPWLANSELASPSSSASTGFCSGNASPTLGKHSREEKTEKSLWIPKTLRIDDAHEAAKSSIFATLGIIKPDETGKFKAFSSSMAGGTGKEGASNTTHLLHANPAAMSRSQSFQEIIS